MIKLRNVEKRFDEFELNCSLSIPKGRITGIVGANGSGKTTLFKLILGLIFPDKGNIEVFNHEELSARDKTDIGFIFQNSFYDKNVCIQKTIDINKIMYPKFNESNFYKECEEYNVSIVGELSNLSNGAIAKLKLLLATSYDAKLLILDEPTTGLDVVARKEILNLLREYMDEERSIVISSHIASDLENFCDDIYFLHEGKIILHEEMDTILDQYVLLKVSNEQYNQLDKTYITYKRSETYGYSCLSKEKQFYQDNYKDFVIEDASIDAILEMIMKGELL